MKRFFDVVVALVSFIILFPILLVCLLVCGIDTASSGIFLQPRIGQYGVPFTIFKFRTMHRSKKTISAWGVFVRKYKIDELPQLLNVLFGTMSLVGPRPDIAGYYDTLTGEEKKILQLKPGLTSEAAIKYANEEVLLKQQQNPLAYNDTVIFPDKVKLNLAYYYNHTFWGDIKLLLKTGWLLIK